jgi:flagellin
MGLSILSNIPSLEAQNQLAITNTDLQNTLFQLSSGSKINSGADDPAGLSIADGLQANISALTQSAQNVTDGVGMLQTADGALSQVTTLLNRAVTLATEAGNAGLTTDQQSALQNEYASITAEINQIGSNTTYNNNQVFTNQLTSVFLSDGSQTDAADPTISVTIPQLSASALGLSSYASGTLDFTANPSAGNSVQIGQQVYTFVAQGSATAAGDVALGSGSTALQTTLQNLEDAVNGTGTAGAGTYGVGTAVNNQATITSVNGGSASVQALTAGAAGNNVALVANLTSNVGGLTGTLSGGVNQTNSTGTLTLAANPQIQTTATSTLTMSALPDTLTYAQGTVDFSAGGGTQPTAGNATGSLSLAGAQPGNASTVTVGNTTYTFLTSGNWGSAVAGDVEISTVNTAGTMANLVDAINNVATAGVFTGTAGAGTVWATDYTPGSTSVNLTAIGADTNGAAGDGLVTGNAGGALTVVNTANGGTSDTVTVGNTRYTFVAAGAAVTGNEVALGGTAHQTLLNLAGAVNNGGTGGSVDTYSTNATAAGTASMSVNGNVGTVTATTAGVGVAGNHTGNSTVLTSSGSAFITAGVNPSGVLSGGAPADTLQIGNTTYTFVAPGDASGADQVAVVTSDATLNDNIVATLQNLEAALVSPNNTTGTDTTFGVGTTANGFATLGNISSNAQGPVTATLTAVTAGAGVLGGTPATDTGMFTVVTPTQTQTNSITAGAWAGGYNPDTVHIGNVNYTFVAAGQATGGGAGSNLVALGSNPAGTLANLMAAVNAGATTGIGGGSVGGVAGSYNVATVQTGAGMAINPQNLDQAVLTATTAGVNNNTTLTASFLNGTTTGAVSGSGDLAGGVANSAATGYFNLTANPLNGNTVTIGTMTYTFVTGSPTAANQVAINSNSVTTTLSNLAAAVTGGNGSGSAYGAGTIANGGVTSFTVVGNQATITASAVGAGTAGQNGASGTGNYLTLTANLSNGVGGGAIPTPTMLSGGSDATNAKATGILNLGSLPQAMSTVTIGTTAYTFVSGTPTGTDQVALGVASGNTTAIEATLNNLMEAVNYGVGGNGAGLGTIYSGISHANTQATITGVSGDQANVQAVSGGSQGNNIALVVGDGQSLGGGGVSVDLNSATEAQNALTVIAGAISSVAAARGAIGSSINQMNAAVQVMNNTSQNLTSSLSGIQDANIGQVVANMSKYQVLEQTGIAALTQANQQEQTVLKLLQ